MAKLERTYEKNHVVEVECSGGVSLKWVCPGRRGYPDRIDLYPITNSKHIEIVEKYVRFSEMKTPINKLQDCQKRRHKELTSMGFSVKVKS